MNLFRRKRNQTIIIGIHGLTNKPPKNLLRKWWKAAIREGLTEYYDYKSNVWFDMVYWADTLYKKPKNPQIQDAESDQFLEEPYLTKAQILEYTNSGIMRRLNKGFRWVKEYLFLHKYGLAQFQHLFNYVISKNFRYLDRYYATTNSLENRLTEEPVKKVIRERLARKLIRHRKRKTILIAHSMGSIVALDVLQQLQNTNVGINTLITIGSPLGLPMIRKKFLEEHGLGEDEKYICPTPENVGAWFNYYDNDDQLAAHHGLSNGFRPNKSGIKPLDLLVTNDYKNFHTGNAHKSYGYLRTEEVSKIIYQSILGSQSALMKLIKKLFSRRIK